MSVMATTESNMATRRIATFGKRSLALTHNLGGYPGEMVSFVSILGIER